LRLELSHDPSPVRQLFDPSTKDGIGISSIGIAGTHRETNSEGEQVRVCHVAIISARPTSADLIDSAALLRRSHSQQRKPWTGEALRLPQPSPRQQ
jgi:hypothetical protein